MDDLNKFKVKSDSNIRDAVKIMDIGGIGFVVITNEFGKILGIMTDGDFRRGVLNGISLDENIMKICNTNFKSLVSGNVNPVLIGETLTQTKGRPVPVLNDGFLEDIITEDNLYEKRLKKPLKFPVVIMAGGKGTRLDPFTKILPKPLIPIGNKPILEIIIDNFREYRVDKFYLSVNYKSKIIKSYFEELNPSYQIEYIIENEPLGTAGSLKFIEGLFEGSFFVSNCDIIINADYYDIGKFHVENDNDITIVVSVKNIHIPYGVCEIEKGGNLLKVNEKPELSFLVNTGMYVLKTSVLKFIPDNKFFNITDLFDEIKHAGGKIGVFPISENSWIDIGQWPEYTKALELLGG